jgi:hypothetical protein
MKIFNKLIRKFEDEMAAAAVAQTGELEMALQIIKESASNDHYAHPSQSKQEMTHLSVRPVEGE